MFSKLSFQKWTFNKAVKKKLLAELGNDKTAHLLDRVWNIYEKIPESPLKDESRAVGLMLSTARKNIALYKVLIELDTPKEKTQKYIEEINWEINRIIGAPMFVFSIIKGKKPVARVKWINDVLWKYLFTKPFKRVQVDSDTLIAFNITRCPFQEYYRSQNVIELCEHTSCSQDYLLAKTWHSKFIREQTLARGGEFCDFRFYVE